MVHQRTGLNRTLFWLYSGHGRWPYLFRWALLALDAVTIALFLAHPLLSWRGGYEFASGAWARIDIAIAIFITLDFLARLYIARSKLRFFTQLHNLADILVVGSLIAEFFVDNLIFLRILRAVRIVRAFQFLDRSRTISKWLDKNGSVIEKVVNLAVFIFIMTALVYVNQQHQNDLIDNYVDALYFTVTTLTTTGFGDVLLEGRDGRWLSIFIMVMGVTLFLQLIRAIAMGERVERKCGQCGLASHERDSVHCRRCGSPLYENGMAADRQTPKSAD